MTSSPGVNTRWMRGPMYLRNILAGYLADNAPGRITAMRQEWNLPDAEMPQIERYDKDEPQFIDNSKPTVIQINISNVNSMARVDVDDLIAEQYRFNYSVRVYLWVKAGPIDESTDSGFTRVIRLRELLAVAIRSTLLSSVSLKTPDCELKQETVNENYSDVEKTNGDRYYGGVYWEFNVLVDEALVGSMLGTADQIFVPVSMVKGSLV